MALRAAALTDGLGRSDRRRARWCSSGYDRDFADVARLARAPAARRAGCRAGAVVELDRDAGTVRVPAGVRLDLGATAKALAADRAARRALPRRRATGVLVNLGGDIATAGPRPAGRLAGARRRRATAPAPTRPGRR